MNIHTQDNYLFDTENHMKVLGLRWNPSHDNFSYDLREEIKGLSKRSILSTTAKMLTLWD